MLDTLTQVKAAMTLVFLYNKFKAFAQNMIYSIVQANNIAPIKFTKVLAA